MPAWTDITNALVAVGAKPFATTIQALRDNPAAMAEGAAGAPKIRVPHMVSGAAARNQVFTGLGDYSGISFELKARNNSGAARDLQIEYSTNGGSSWSSTTPLLGSGGNDQLTVSGALDFASGALMAIFASTNVSFAPGRVSTTMSGASLAIDAVRFIWSGTNADITAIITPNGGSA